MALELKRVTEAGAYTLTGQDVALIATHNPLVLGAGAFTLTGQAVSAPPPSRSPART